MQKKVISHCKLLLFGCRERLDLELPDSPRSNKSFGFPEGKRKKWHSVGV